MPAINTLRGIYPGVTCSCFGFLRPLPDKRARVFLYTNSNYNYMGLLNNIKDAFNKAEFTVAPNKKLKTISSEFKKTFDLTLVFYKGVTIADGELTLNQLGKKTTKEVNTTADGIQIKGNTKVGDAEKMFDKAFGVTVQIKDKTGKNLVPNDITIGQAARGEYK